MFRKGALLALMLLALVGVLEVSRAQSPTAVATETSLFPIAGLVVAAVSLLIAALAMRSARKAQSDFLRFSCSIEMALRELALRSDRDAASLGELNRKIGEEIHALTELAESGARHSQVRQTGSRNAETESDRALPAVPVVQPPEAGVATPESIGNALVGAVAKGELEVSLQPIISVSQGAATGFEVHARVEPAGGGRVLDIRRLAQPVPGLDLAAFEAAMVRAAVAAGRRQLGTATERMPFHIAISEALLGSAQGVEAIAELARIHKALAASLVFSVPASTLAARGEIRERLDLLTAAGFRLAVEGWDGAASEAQEAQSRGVHFLKIAANRLLDRERTRRKALSGLELAETAANAGIAIIATGVSRDDDAVGLIDLGIDLMEGERFSGPRRIRSSAARQAVLADM